MCSRTHLVPADPRAVEPTGDELAVHDVLQFDPIPVRPALADYLVGLGPYPRLPRLREEGGGPRVSLDLVDGLDDGLGGNSIDLGNRKKFPKMAPKEFLKR